MNNKVVLIGSDPELFVVDSDGNPSSAIGMVGGDKKNPVACDGGALQEDNVLLEFNTDPTADAEQFVKTIRTVMSEARKVAKEYNHDIQVKASNEYTQDFLMSQPSGAMEFGCTPDFNALDGSQNGSPNPFTTLRTAGGHVHIGWESSTHCESPDVSSEQLEVMQMADYLLGAWSVLHDSDGTRRELYGRAGAFRAKSYGAEYRVMSNFWLRDDALISEVHKRAQACFTNLKMLDQLVATFPHADVQRAINESDVEYCQTVVKLTEDMLND